VQSYNQSCVWHHPCFAACHVMPSLPKDRDAHLPVGPAQACGSTPSLMKTLCCCKAQVRCTVFTCQPGADIANKEAYADHIFKLYCQCQDVLQCCRTTETSSRAPCLRQAHGACRIAVMLWNPMAKKPIHLGYWPSSLAAARMADK